jgi:hypothetical protein
MIKRKIDSILDIRLAEAIAVVASRDYQVIKAARAGVPVDELYPDHTAWYDAASEKVHDIEAKIEARDAAALARQKALEEFMPPVQPVETPKKPRRKRGA